MERAILDPTRLDPSGLFVGQSSPQTRPLLDFPVSNQFVVKKRQQPRPPLPPVLGPLNLHGPSAEFLERQHLHLILH